MPIIDEKNHGVFYGHGTVTSNMKFLSGGKRLVLYGPPQTTLADEVAKYIILYLQQYPKVSPLKIGDLARISSGGMTAVQRKNPPRKLDSLSEELWSAATPLGDYPMCVSTSYLDVVIGPLESVSIYRVRPPFVTEFNRGTKLSDALPSTEFDVVHVATCQARSFHDDLIILTPGKSSFAYKTDVAVESNQETYDKTIEELYAEKVGSPQSFTLNFGNSSNTTISSFEHDKKSKGQQISPFSIQPFSGEPRPQPSSQLPSKPEFSVAPECGMLACHNKTCQVFVPWDGKPECPKCHSSDYSVRYICRNRGCPVFDRGQSEFRKTSNKCQYCDQPTG
jgi:RNA polymerase subunit RPABC4/transcription elongation factor Spt4